MAPSFNADMLTQMIVGELERQGRGSQTRLAEAVGVKVQTVNKWYLGQTAPDPGRWAAIEDAFGWERGEIASRVLPTIDSRPTADVLRDLAAAVRDLGERVQRLERSQGGRASR